jgi:plasmid replication initiation protein
MVRFGLPRELQPILAQSGRWGRIKAEIVHAMSSKYAIALYELIQARINLDTCVETFTLEKFRALIGVPPGKMIRGPDLRRFVLDTAALEINALADVGVTLDVKRKGGRPNGAITHVTMAWWRKQGDEYRAALQELNRPKVGRKARLQNIVESIS